jgi:hypothetical protein
MQPIWINLGQTSRLDGAFITLRGNRTPAGYIRLSIYFSAAAVARMSLKCGERMLVGLDGPGQQLALRETIYGGTALSSRAGRRELSMAPTLPTFVMPEPQTVLELQVSKIGRDWLLPFRFDASQLLVAGAMTNNLQAAA